MTEEFVSDQEYPICFSHLGGLRSRMAQGLLIKPESYILDLATGYGYCAIELAKKEPPGRLRQLSKKHPPTWGKPQHFVETI